jgi:UDP-GlcNAc:undecaprenyl-phosphate GlcNAc-1-phosphate transferase
MNLVFLMTKNIRELLHIKNFNIIITIIPVLTALLLLYQYVLTNYDHLISAIIFCLIPAVFSFFYILILTPLVIFIARKFKIMDHTTDQDLDKKPTPLLGGVSLYLAFILVGLLYIPFTPQWKSILIGSSIIFFIGTIDDIRPLSSTVRLFGQISAGFIVMSQGLLVSFLPNNWWGSIGAVIITLIWILGIINATNFADGVDGLAAGIIVIAALFFFLITLHLEQYHVSLLCTILIGCGLGFLVFNFKPAKIYLGDGGSTFLGFLIASIALYGEWSSRGPIIALGIPVLILGVLIFDMIYITFSRIRNGHVNSFREWLDYTGRDHFHHRLINLGFSERNSVIFIYIVCVILGINALQIENARLSYPVVIQLIQSTLIFVLIIMLMLRGRKLSS